MQINRRTILKGVPVTFLNFAWFTLLCISVALPAAQGEKKPSKPVTTADGRPIRKIYIHSASFDMTNSASIRLAQNTCLTTVSNPEQADAILNVGAALPGLDGGVATPGVFGPSARRQTTGNAQRTASEPAGDVDEPPSGWPGNAGENLNVSLAAPGNTSQKLWEPTPHSNKSWSDQLRIAAGCPVCPDEHFNRHKYKTYRNWIQAECPTVLSSSSMQ